MGRGRQRHRSGLPLILLVVTIAAIACDKRTPIGHFDIYTSGGGMPDSHPHSSLYYKRRLLTEHYGAAVIDPRNPDRILFSGDTTVSGPGNPCGTYLFDGRTGTQRRIASWPGPHSWAPNSCCALVSGGYEPRVVMLDTGTDIDLPGALSASGRQLELEPLGWSPDSLRVAVVAVLDDPSQPAGSIKDFDLVEITLAPLHAEYVATIRNTLFGLWTSDDYGWLNGRLMAASTGKRSPIIHKDVQEIGWSAMPPTTLRTPVPCG